MDAQIRKGLLEFCVLAALRQGDSYGYQLLKDIPEYIAMTESTLYPILRRLETGDRVSSYTREHNGRLRKYFRITKQGLDTWIPFWRKERSWTDCWTISAKRVRKRAESEERWGRENGKETVSQRTEPKAADAGKSERRRYLDDYEGNDCGYGGGRSDGRRGG